ncbi:hypothetical protein OIO90_003905 [Microbotryomycetes sp. JL221]|nr:hypothetical protein OIO90_003905 [Microbotryomycetes sp. JL221]
MSPSKQLAAIYYGAKDLRIESIDVPSIEGKPDAVLIKIAWCGICGTDLHEFESGPILCPTTDKAHPITGATLPICMGHEFSGIVEEVGSNVKEYQVGDKVVVEPTISCHTCYACKNDYTNACESLGWVGLSGGEMNGGLSEFVAIDQSYVHKLPENVSLQFGAMVEPLSVAMHAVDRANFQKGATALVLGCGPIGAFTTKSLIARGASKVIVSEPSGSRRKMAELAGAHHVLDPTKVDIVKEVQKLTGDDKGVSAAFECAGVQQTLETAISAVRTRGIVVNVAIWSYEPKVNMNALVLGEKTVTGVICYKNNHKPAIEALASGKIDLEGFVTATTTLNDVIEKGFKELIHNNEQHVKILVSPKGDSPN